MSCKVMGTTPKFECDYICKAAKYLSAILKDPTWEDWGKPRHPHGFREWIFEPSILITKPKYFSVACKVEHICVEIWSYMHYRLDWWGPWRKEKGGGGWTHQTFFVLPTKPEASCSHLARLRLREWFIIAKINELRNTEEFGIRFAVPHQPSRLLSSRAVSLFRDQKVLVEWFMEVGE